MSDNSVVFGRGNSTSILSVGKTERIFDEGGEHVVRDEPISMPARKLARMRSDVAQLSEVALTEASRASLEEMLFRIKQRDGWLKFQLAGQLILFGLASNIEGFGVKPASPRPELLLLAIPAAFVLTVLYCIEDRLIHLLSTYRSSAFPGGFEQVVRSRRAFDDALNFRFAAQLVCFAFIPGLLFIYALQLTLSLQGTAVLLAISVVEVVLLSGICWFLLIGFRRRRQPVPTTEPVVADRTERTSR